MVLSFFNNLEEAQRSVFMVCGEFIHHANDKYGL